MINTASDQELETLPGIGPIVARRICAVRDGIVFRSIDDLKEIKGIRQQIITQLEPYIDWSEPAAPPPEPHEGGHPGHIGRDILLTIVTVGMVLLVSYVLAYISGEYIEPYLLRFRSAELFFQYYGVYLTGVVAILSLVMGGDTQDTFYPFRILAELRSELVGAAIISGLVFVVVVLPMQRVENEKLLRDFSSQDHGTALRAAEELAAKGALTDGSLKGVDLRRAALSRAYLRFAELEEADFSFADLTGADLWGSKLKGAKFYGTVFEKAILIGADFTDASLEYCDLTGAALDVASFAGAYLHDVNLRGAALNGADFQEARLHGVDFRGADLSGSNLRYAGVGHTNACAVLRPFGLMTQFGLQLDKNTVLPNGQPWNPDIGFEIFLCPDTFTNLLDIWPFNYYPGLRW